MTVTKEDILKFQTYVKNHVYIVNLLGKKVFNKSFKNHDLDKQTAKGEKLNLYAYRNACMSRTESPSKQDKDKINKLVGYHVKNNKHHPEYWDNEILAENYDESKKPICHAEKMSIDALEEMCCDWAAVALKKNVPLSSWYNQTVDKRFFFTKSQKKFIKKYLNKMEEIIKEDNITFPGEKRYSAADASFKEGVEKTALITFGRFNPPTTGHMLLFKTMHNIPADGKFIFLSHKQEKPKKRNPLNCKNPLPYETKFIFVKEFLAETSYTDLTLEKSDAINILGACQDIYRKGYQNLIICLGSDRTEDMLNLVRRYNGEFSEENEGYRFNNITAVTAGSERIESGNDIDAMSASKQRELAVEGNYEEFKKGVPSKNENVILDLYKDIRTYMGIE